MPVDGWDAAALDRLAEQLGDLAGLRRLAGQGQAAADAASVAASDVLGAAADPGQR